MIENFSNPARENFEHAKGIEVALELKIKRQREAYEACVTAMQEHARIARLDTAGEDREVRRAAEKLRSITSKQHDLFRKMEAIIPSTMLGSSFIDRGLQIPKKGEDAEANDASQLDADFADKFKDALNGLTYQETTDFNDAHRELAELLKRKNTISHHYHSLSQAIQPMHQGRMKKLDYLGEETRKAKEELDRVISMRSPRMVAIINSAPEEVYLNGEQEREAHLIAQEKMAKAYELGADDDQALEVWESEFVSQLMADDDELDAAAALAMFDNEEQKAAEEKAAEAIEENISLKRELEVERQKTAILVGETIASAKESAADVFAKEANWKELKPHKGDVGDTPQTKVVLNALKPTGKTLEVLLEDKDKHGRRDDHARRHLALRTGVVFKGHRTKVEFIKHIEITKFRCRIEGVICNLAFKLDSAGNRKLSIATAFNQSKRWTVPLEKNTDLHTVPHDAADNPEYSLETLAKFHTLIAIHTIS